MSCLGSRWINEATHQASHVPVISSLYLCELSVRIWGDNCWLGSGSDCELAVRIWVANVNWWLGSGERMTIVGWELLVRNGYYWLGMGQ